jgi:hypothetical protein
MKREMKDPNAKAGARIALLFIAVVFLKTPHAHAHAGHHAADEAPKGPFVVKQIEDVWLDCASPANVKFKTPYRKITLHQNVEYKNDYSVLLGKDVHALKAGDVLKAPKLVTEKCDHPFKIRCDSKGQPVMLQYTASQKDVFCQGRFNFVIEYDRDLGK